LRNLDSLSSPLAPLIIPKTIPRGSGEETAFSSGIPDLLASSHAGSRYSTVSSARFPYLMAAAYNSPKEPAMRLIQQFGEMWARNSANIEDVPGSRVGGVGVYILYDGSTPVYVGKGNIKQRLKDANNSERRGNAWDYFSWYIPNNEGLVHDVEVLLIRVLPSYLRHLTRQSGHFKGVSSSDQKRRNRTPTYIDRAKLMKSGK
jgi:hypothetical protein